MKTDEFTGIDRRLQEAAHYLGRWSEAMSARWEKVMGRIRAAGFKIPEEMQVPIEGEGHVVVAGHGQGQARCVFVQFEGALLPLPEAIIDFKFKVEALPEIRKAVQDALDGFEQELEKKLGLLPGLVQEFAIDAVDHALEKRIAGRA